MKRILSLLALVFFLVPFVLAVECEDIMRKGYSSCQIISPANLSCSTYSMYDDSGTLIEGPIIMPELYSGTGIYSFEFNQTIEKGYIIHLCDGSLATILVGKGNIVEKLEDDHDPGSWGGTAGHSVFEDPEIFSKFKNTIAFGNLSYNMILAFGALILILILLIGIYYLKHLDGLKRR